MLELLVVVVLLYHRRLLTAAGGCLTDRAIIPTLPMPYTGCRVDSASRTSLSPSTAVYIPIDVFCTYVSTSYIRSTSSTTRVASGYGDGTAGMLAGRRYGL